MKHFHEVYSLISHVTVHLYVHVNPYLLPTGW